MINLQGLHSDSNWDKTMGIEEPRNSKSLLKQLNFDSSPDTWVYGVATNCGEMNLKMLLKRFIGSITSFLCARY